MKSNRSSNIGGSSSSRSTRGSFQFARLGRGRAYVFLLLLLLGLAVQPCRGEWTLRDSGTSETFHGIAFGNDTFVAVGNLGCTFRSTDNGVNWESINGLYNTLNGVAFGNGTFVAVDDFGTAFRSTDNGATWEHIVDGLYNDILKGVAFGNNTFVAVGVLGHAFRSTDNGATWEFINGLYHNLNGVAFGNGTFVAVDDFGTAFRSTDNGATWEHIVDGLYNDILKGVAFGNNTFVAVGVLGHAFRSTDNGATWEFINGLYHNLNGVAFGAGRFVAVGVLGTIWESDEDSSSVWNDDDEAFGGLMGVAFGDNTFVAVGELGHVFTKGIAPPQISPVSKAFTSAGGSGNIAVTIPAGVAWTAVSSEPAWLHIDSGESGEGPGTVVYHVDRTPDEDSRAATILVADLSHAVTQEGDSTATTIHPSRVGFEYCGGTGTVAVTAPDGRFWEASTNRSWISITSGATGTGNGMIAYLVKTNFSSSTLYGDIAVTGCSDELDITQQPLYYEILPPTSVSFGYAATNGSFNVSASPGAPWAPTTSESWIHIVSYTGSGNGTVQYDIDMNPSTSSSRTGEIWVQGLAYTIHQSHEILDFIEISPTSLSHGSSSSTGRFHVASPSSHVWIAHESLGWVSIVGAGSGGYAGTGDGWVNYTVEQNTASTTRSGSILVEGESHHIDQAASGHSINPVSGNYPAWDSGTIGGSFSVSLPLGSNSGVSSSQSWITDVHYGKQGIVGFRVANNPSWDSRRGTVDVTWGISGIMQYQVRQSGGTLDVSPETAGIGYNGGNGEVEILETTTPNYWTAESDSSWLTITSGSSGTGQGTVGYHVAANPFYSSRSGTITIGKKTVAVSQATRPLVFSLNPYEKTFSNSGGSTFVQVYGPPDHSWTAQESLPWVTITSGSSGTGDGTVFYSVDANPDLGLRSGTITIAGETYSITQDGTLGFFTWPTAAGFGSQGGTQRFTISSSPSGVAWTVVNEVPWIEIMATNVAAGYIDIRVLQNSNASSRSGTVQVGNSTYSSYTCFTVNQDGAPASYSIAPTSAGISGSGGTESVVVSATEGAGWTATSPVGWVAVSSGSGTGIGTVNYAVGPNSTTNARSAVLTIAGKSHTVSQASGDTPDFCWVDPSSIRENLPGGTTVGTLQVDAYLAVASPVFSFASIPGYSDNGAFSISNNLLLATGPFDAETKDLYYPGISAGNGHGGSWEGAVVIQVDNDSLEDADADGLPEEDEIFQGSDDTVVDSDGDGVGDGDEVRVAGTDPLDFYSNLRIAQFARTGSVFDMQWATVPGKTYRVLASDNLEDGFPYLLGETQNGYFDCPIDARSHRFFQLAVRAPTVQQQAKLLASDGVAEDRFGNAAGISGNTLVVGAKFDDDLGSSSGSAYLYERSSASNDWNFVVKLTAADGAVNDEFGYAVAIDGDTVAVGAKKDNSARGAVYLFERDAGGVDQWGQVKKITASDSATSDYFGYRVVLDGDRLAVGSGHGNSRQGAAYLFERNSGGTGNWGEVKKLTTPDGQIDDQFGWSIALSGDTVAVGAYADDDHGADAGAVYLFERDSGGAGAWGQTHKLFGAGAVAGDRFGVVLALDGDTLAVGAPQDNERARRAGAAYVFERDRNGVGAWGQTRKVRFAEGASWNLFGNSLDLEGDNLAIGAWNARNADGVKSGTAFLFQRDLNGSDRWGLLQRFAPEDPAEGQSFGGPISISGDTILAGAAGDDSLGDNAGAAYLFEVEIP